MMGMGITLKPLIGASLVVSCLALTACNVNDSSAQADLNKTIAAAKDESMKIQIKLQDSTLIATLHDNPSAKDFASMLPLKLTLKDYSSTEKISDLPRKLTADGAPPGADPSIGDIAYYAPWGNLAIYYKDFGYSDGLILLGKLDGGTEPLSGSRPLEATIELLDDVGQRAK